MEVTKPWILLWISYCLLGEALVSGFISSGPRVPWHSRSGGFDGSAAGGRSRRNVCVVVLQATKTTSMEQLVFGSDYCYVSEPLPAGTTKEAAEAFLMKNSTLRDLLFGVGGTRPVTLLETTQELLDLWEEACEYYGCSSERKPTAEDLMLGVEASVQFPGMKLITNSASGVFVMSDPQTGLKQYQSFFVAEQQRTEGLAPAVWLFNRLMNFSNRNKKVGQFAPPSGRARSVISVVVNDNGTTSESVCFSQDVELKITVNFPSVLLKILPMPKEKMEEKAGLSIRKALAKDVDAAMKATRKAFVEEAAVTAAAPAQGI